MSLSIFHLTGETKPCAAEGCDREIKKRKGHNKSCELCVGESGYVLGKVS